MAGMRSHNGMDSFGEVVDTIAESPHDSVNGVSGVGSRAQQASWMNQTSSQQLAFQDNHMSGGSLVSGYPGHGGMVPVANGLDLSFGYTPLQFEKINLIGSGLTEQAISSLVLSVPNITYLDLRGNKLNAAFGWRLVKAMRKRYLQLEYCNGVHMRSLRDNTVETLNLANFSGHLGMYGIEVVGAIFLAHFLRLNSSLTNLNFRRNDVQKDGAKALAQSLLSNPQCALRIVNTMGPSVCPSGKPGIDFAMFRTSELRTVHLQKRLLDDDDFVFLEEWLRRYDCVTDLDISHNLIHRDGIRKLTRYIKDTKTLTRLVCRGLPVDLEGTALLARAVVENETLDHVALPLGPCDEDPERQQMLQQLGVGIARHPTLKTFGTAKLMDLRSQNLPELRSERHFVNWHKPEIAVYMWCTAAIKPKLEKLHFGAGGKPTKEYPSLNGSPRELWPALIGIVYDVHRSLTDITITVPKNYGPLAMELMRALTRCTVLKNLTLNGYASAVLRDAQLPAEWSAVGSVPRWLLDDRVKKIKVHWQALHGLLTALPHLDAFNDISLEGGYREQPEKTVLLMLQCLVGVAAEFTEGGGGEQLVMNANLKKEADVDAFCDVLRMLSRTPVLINFKIQDQSSEVIKEKQQRLAAPLSGVPAGEGGARFTHTVILMNDVTSEALLQSLDCNAPLREFGIERVEPVLKGLFTALCGREKPLPVQRIRLQAKWNKDRVFCKKRFTDQQHRWLDSIHAALIRSDFVEIENMDQDMTLNRETLSNMSPQEFAEFMSGIQTKTVDVAEKFDPVVQWRCFPSYRAFADPVDPEAPVEPLLVPLPMDDESRNDLELNKLSLCMSNMRTHVAQVARPDEFPDTSRPLWDGPRLFVTPGDFNEMDPQPNEEDEAAGEEDAQRPMRYHWREHLRLGSAQANAFLAASVLRTDLPFVDVLVQESIKSLFIGNTSLTWLDLRGNGLTKEDAELLLALVEPEDQILATLNMIPVTIAGASACKSLVLDGTGVEKNAGAVDDEEQADDPFGDGGVEASGEAYSKEAMEADMVRLDEGDGVIFLSLVNPKYFPDLNSVVLRRHEIPDATLPHITDALLNLTSICQLQLSHLRLSCRGASLLLHAVAEMAPRLLNLNGLPLSRLVQLRDSSDHSPQELSGSIEWNDFSLGAMARLNLWSTTVFAPSAADGTAPDFQLQGKSITDVGLRGLCAMLRHFASQERAASNVSNAPRAGMGVYLTQIDLSSNPQITDATVADLTRTLQHPTLGSSLRHSLRELSVRSCARLRTRSAFELLNLVHHVRDVVRDGSSSALGTSLQLLNGVDLQTLFATARASGSSSRSGAPPMLLRTYVELDKRGKQKAQFAALSECDVHFYASMLHQFPQIPYCHVHIVIPPEDTSNEVRSWGRESSRAVDDVAWEEARVSNDCPFPPPNSALSEVVIAVQAHFRAARQLFEACPISTQLRVSAAPCVRECEDLILEGDGNVLISLSTVDRGVAAASSSSFGKVQQRLHDNAVKKRRKTQGEAAPRRPLYVNNINSQRLHDCFRTLYGQNDLDVEHTDILPIDHREIVRFSSDVDVCPVFAIATSVDLQHLDLRPSHLNGLSQVSEMAVLTHVNLNHNNLSDTGARMLFEALVATGCSVVHVSLSSNSIGDKGVHAIAGALGSLPRLTSLELCDNFVQERGSIALAEAINGATHADDYSLDDSVPVRPLHVLSIDLRGNRGRELGAMRWAEVVAKHPTLQFLCLAQNELGRWSADSFLGLVYAAVASSALSVLDLRDNFPLGPNLPTVGPPPAEVIQELLDELPAGEFDAAEVRQGVFIRRHRGGGGAEKKGRQPQQGQQGSTRRAGAEGQPGANGAAPENSGNPSRT